MSINSMRYMNNAGYKRLRELSKELTKIENTYDMEQEKAKAIQSILPELAKLSKIEIETTLKAMKKDLKFNRSQIAVFKKQIYSMQGRLAQKKAPKEILGALMQNNATIQNLDNSDCSSSAKKIKFICQKKQQF